MENWAATYKRMKLECSITPHTKINPKWIENLNIRLDILKLLEENIGRTLTYHSTIILDLPPRVMKTKINKWYLIKAFCTAKKIINKLKK